LQRCKHVVVVVVAFTRGIKCFTTHARTHVTVWFTIRSRVDSLSSQCSAAVVTRCYTVFVDYNSPITERVFFFVFWLRLSRASCWLQSQNKRSRQHFQNETIRNDVCNKQPTFPPSKERRLWTLPPPPPLPLTHPPVKALGRIFEKGDYKTAAATALSPHCE
jgi:hypothetical protein